MINARETQFLIAASLAALVLLAGWAMWQNSLPNLSRISWQTLALACVFYPFCEEVIFRGLLQKELKRLPFNSLLNQSLANFRINRIYVSSENVIASVLFALAHAWYFKNLTALVVFFPSLAFGYAFQIREKLAAPIILHGLYNLYGLFFVAFYRGG